VERHAHDARRLVVAHQVLCRRPITPSVRSQKKMNEE
jgi:hypothetical protein